MDRAFIYPYPPTAFKVQKVTAELFTQNKRAYCLNELGTGKTRSTLFAYDWLRFRFDLGSARAASSQ